MSRRSRGAARRRLRRMRRTRPLRRLARRVRALLRFAVRSACAALALILLWVGAYRWIDPPTTYYIEAERLRQGGVDRAWRDLDAMSPHLPRAALAAEDAGFCAHWGFDLDAIRDALDANAEGGRLRGGSTISQQVAKNVFLWPERSWTRKGLEAGFTLLIEAFWPKRRIVEVYLNVAEFGPGVFGAEAGARAAFGAPAADLGLRQSARLAAILPDPKGRSAARPSGFVERRARSIADGAETLRRDGRAACLGVLD